MSQEADQHKRVAFINCSTYNSLVELSVKTLTIVYNH